MLALKLALVPTFLLAISVAAARFGPSVAGWLAGLPVVTGPILFVLALENGKDFASAAACSSAAGVLAMVGFSLAYAHASRRFGWQACLPLALLVWALCVAVVAALPAHPLISFVIALTALLTAPRLFPPRSEILAIRRVSPFELLARMLAGALLTLGVTHAAQTFGGSWSGLLAVFPVIGTVLAVSSHRVGGHAYTAAVMRATATGLYSSAAFCLTLVWALQALHTAAAFIAAIAACLTVQASARAIFWA
jgi:hypothetical protein